MRFAWSKKYSLGVSAIDEQHKHFFDILNATSDLVESGEIDKEALLLVISEMDSHSLYHFTTEEKHFHEVGYQGADEHTKQHDAFRKKINEFLSRAKLENDPVKIKQLGEEVVDYAIVWLSHHIVVEDAKFSKLTKGKSDKLKKNKKKGRG